MRTFRHFLTQHFEVKFSSASRTSHRFKKDWPCFEGWRPGRDVTMQRRERSELHVVMHACPADTRRKNNVIITSKRRRFDVIMTLFLRHVPAAWNHCRWLVHGHLLCCLAMEAMVVASILPDSGGVWVASWNFVCRNHAWINTFHIKSYRWFVDEGVNTRQVRFFFK